MVPLPGRAVEQEVAAAIGPIRAEPGAAHPDRSTSATRSGGQIAEVEVAGSASSHGRWGAIPQADSRLARSTMRTNARDRRRRRRALPLRRHRADAPGQRSGGGLAPHAQPCRSRPGRDRRGARWPHRGDGRGRAGPPSGTPTTSFDSAAVCTRSAMRRFVLARMSSLTAAPGRCVASTRCTPRLRPRWAIATIDRRNSGSSAAKRGELVDHDHEARQRRRRRPRWRRRDVVAACAPEELLPAADLGARGSGAPARRGGRRDRSRRPRRGGAGRRRRRRCRPCSRRGGSDSSDGGVSGGEPGDERPEQLALARTGGAGDEDVRPVATRSTSTVPPCPIASGATRPAPAELRRQAAAIAAGSLALGPRRSPSTSPSGIELAAASGSSKRARQRASLVAVSSDRPAMATGPRRSVSSRSHHPTAPASTVSTSSHTAGTWPLVRTIAVAPRWSRSRTADARSRSGAGPSTISSRRGGGASASTGWSVPSTFDSERWRPPPCGSQRTHRQSSFGPTTDTARSAGP